MNNRADTLRHIDEHLREAWRGLTMMNIYTRHYHFAAKYNRLKDLIAQVQVELTEVSEDEDSAIS
jgi:hypothetical protein